MRFRIFTIVDSTGLFQSDDVSRTAWSQVSQRRCRSSKGHRFLSGASTPVNAILGGWQVNCIYTFSTGTPIAISQAVNQIGLGNPSQRPNETGNPDSLATSEAQRITGWFNTAAFTLAAPYTYGTTPRTLPNIRQPGIDNADASIFKSFRPIERAPSSRFVSRYSTR